MSLNDSEEKVINKVYIEKIKEKIKQNKETTEQLEEKINKSKERMYYLESKSIQINTNNIYFNKILRIISILLLLILESNNLISTFYSRLLFDKSLSFYFFSLFLLNKIEIIEIKV